MVEVSACARQPGGFVMAPREGENIIYYMRFPKLGAPLTVVLVCFAHGVGTYLLGENSSPSHQLAM
jgi:hypothetical protein